MTRDVKQSCPMCNGPLTWTTAGAVEAQVCLNVRDCGWEDVPSVIVHPGPPHVAVVLRLHDATPWRPAVTLYSVLWADHHQDYVRKEGALPLMDTRTRTGDSPAVRAVEDWLTAQQVQTQGAEDSPNHAA